MTWYELHEFIRGLQRGWEVAGLTVTSDAPVSGLQEIRIRIKQRDGASGPRVGGAL